MQYLQIIEEDVQEAGPSLSSPQANPDYNNIQTFYFYPTLNKVLQLVVLFIY